VRVMPLSGKVVLLYGNEVIGFSTTAVQSTRDTALATLDIAYIACAERRGGGETIGTLSANLHIAEEVLAE